MEEGALAIERYVKSRMRITADQGLGTAKEVAQKLEGDCTEYAMLTAAMCRAEGVPARTAIGLIYADVQANPGGPTSPVLAFHMWTEAWVQGEWRALDSTIGQGGLGAMHLKISDQSWKNEVTAAPLLPTLRVLGRINVEIVYAGHDPRP